jgi:WD40 repeat protein/regulation of enolase protein 1 (concanavalin A-like superfamily)
MSWPLSQDYNEAIQDPQNSFSDAELRASEIVCNALGIPMPRSGNFADVYEVRGPSGARWAVKCFTREVPGLRERYAEISKYLRQANLPFMVDFQYLQQGIRVRGEWYPILKMQWVEGFVLNEFVRENLDKKPILNALGQIWLRMAKRLREANLAHCDLQHGNVMFVPGSTANSLAVKLIDYDGMCVPALAGTKSGEVGHPAFQHPERLRTGAYNQEVDRFSLLAIAAGLRCLTVGGRSLWDRYDTGDNLLFRPSDLQKPNESPLFQELLAIREPVAQTLVSELYRACQGPLEAVPLLTELLPEEKPANKAATAVVRQPQAVPSPDWDFTDEEEESAVVKRQRRHSKGIPLWVWGAGGVAAALLLSIGVGLGIHFRNGPNGTQEKIVAQSNEKTTPTPAGGGQRKPSDTPQLVPRDEDKKPRPPVSPQAGPASPLFRLTPTGDALAVVDEKTGCDWRLMVPERPQIIREFKGHAGKIQTLVFSADGKTAATVAEDQKLKVWDIETGKELQEISIGTKRVVAVALSGNGHRLAWADGDGDLHIHDFEGQSFPSNGNSSRVSCVAFSPDGDFLYCGRYNAPTKLDAAVLRIDLKPGSNKPSFDKRTAGSVCRIAASPDGKFLATAHEGKPSMVCLWDTQTSKILGSLNLPGEVSRELFFSPNGNLLVAESSKEYRVYKVGAALPSVLVKEKLDEQYYVSAAFTADSRKVIFAYGNDRDTSAFTHTATIPRVFLNPSSDPRPRPTLAWYRPIDPDGDCQFREDAGKLTITLPDKKNHDLVAEVGKMNAPRVLRDVEGDFRVEVRIGGDFTSDAVLMAGLLLMVDEKNYLRLERGRFAGKPHCFWELRRDGRRLEDSSITTIPTFEGYLRMERRGNTLAGLHSVDGHAWTQLKRLEIDLPAKVKVGVAAISTSASSPFAPTFDSFGLKQGTFEMVRIDKWLPPGEVVMNKPTPPTRPRRRIRKKPVPASEEIEAARKDIRDKHRAVYESGKWSDVMNALFNDLNRSRNNPPRQFALLCELRDKSAENNIRSGLSQAQFLAADFAVDALDAMCDAFEHSLRTLRPQPAEFVTTGLPLIDEAIGKENYDVLSRLLKIVEPAASSLRADDAKRVMAIPVLSQAKRVQQEYAKLQPERKTLAVSPNDPRANLALGKYHCVWRGDWGEGLPMLARGSDAVLKALAEKDLANPDDPAAEIALAKDWLKYATNPSNSKSQRLACEKRGYYWYQTAASRLKGDKLREVQRSLTLLSKIPELQNPWWPFANYETVRYDAAIGYLRINPPLGIKTREYYRGPIDITVTARSMTTDINIRIGGGGLLTIGEDSFTKKDRLQVFHPDREPNSVGTPIKVQELDLTAKQHFTVRWLVGSSGMKVWLNDKLLLDESRSGYNLSDKYAVSISANSNPIELKSATIRRVVEK